jgi:signal transduction histidine kinase
VSRLDGTVRALLAFSKPTMPKKQRILLRDFVGRIARLAGDQPLARNIRITSTGPAELEVEADPALLEQVLWNLLMNSLEAIRDSGEIRVEHSEFADGIGITVSDTGVGIPDELLGNLFRPFVTTKTNGTGLGLSLCRKIVEAHGGKIGIMSERGKGCVVTIRLPKS